MAEITEDMNERAARAIAEVGGNAWDFNPSDPADVYMRDARAALTAVGVAPQEPSRGEHDWDSLDNCRRCGRGFVGDRANMSVRDCRHALSPDREKLRAEARAQAELDFPSAESYSQYVAGYMRGALAAPVAVDRVKLAEALDGAVGWEELGWDDRKDLASLFQDSCTLPADGLSEGFYSAVIAVANYGYQRAREHAEAAAYDTRNRLGGL